MATKETQPRCKMCGEREKILLGTMNGVEIHYCPKCDKK